MPTPQAIAQAPSLVGETRSAWAFAPLSDLSKITVEGSVPTQKAWSTQKVLIVAAYLDTVAKGDPSKVTPANKALIVKALTASEMAAITAIDRQIPNHGAAMAKVLRSIGDTTTPIQATPTSSVQWRIEDQVKFMGALANRKLVNSAVSDYLLEVMHPIPEHQWGLGTIGATTFKGGWLRPSTETRQMGIVDGYAVAIITHSVGPAPTQTDGDQAHVQQMNKLAGMLKQRLAAEKARG